MQFRLRCSYFEVLGFLPVMREEKLQLVITPNFEKILQCNTDQPQEAPTQAKGNFDSTLPYFYNGNRKDIPKKNELALSIHLFIGKNNLVLVQ